MKYKYSISVFIVVLLLTFNSCFHEDNFQNTRKGNFEALWKIMDQYYCFFDYKKVDWNEVHKRYAPQIKESMSGDELFRVLGNMLNEVRDGHVNLVSTYDMSRYWAWYQGYPPNFNVYIQANYLGSDYGIAGGLRYTILPSNVGYIYYSSFSSAISEANINQVLNRLSKCDGIIIDVRNNGGGNLSNSTLLASHFFRQKTLVGYMMHKRGPKHDDFSSPQAMYITPSRGIICNQPVAVLTNRYCYSSANDFVNAMRYAPNVILVGDRTGGGGGLPFSSELPIGWAVRFSASPTLDAKKQNIESGIAPDIEVDMVSTNTDDIIDKAIQVLKSVKKIN